MINNIFQLIRIKDWLKNIILFFPLIFSYQLLEFEKYNELIIGFIIFCLASSFVYILNDIKDVEEDRIHPVKKYLKPIANNRIKIYQAIYFLIAIFFLILFLSYFVPSIFYHILLYIFINLLYSFFLKKIAIIDLVILSCGYLIRLDTGSNIIKVDSSMLMLITIFSLSFFILSLKRLGELNNNLFTRSNLRFYSNKSLSFLIIISGLGSVIFYGSYIFIKNNKLLITLPFVIFALYRYYKLTVKNTDGEFPIELVFRDKILLSICFSFLIYLLLVFI